MKTPISLLGLCLVLISFAAAAQPAPGAPQARVRGTVLQLDGDKLSVQTKADGVVSVMLGQNTGVNGLAKKSLADIADGGFIGTTAAMGEDHRWHATEVHIFPEDMRGAGEGHYPWDFPNTTMTNATVAGTAKSKDGRTLDLTYEGGEIQIDVASDTPIVTFVPGDRSLLVPGAAVVVLGTRQDDGTINAFAVTAEKDGVKPPM